MAGMLPLVVLGGRAVALGAAPCRREAAPVREATEPGAGPELGASPPRKQEAIDSQSTVASDGAGGSEASDSDEPRTTVQLRNVPPAFSRAMLLSLLDAQGFRARYDFVYRAEDTVADAFVNFLTAEDASRFRCLLNLPGPPGLQREGAGCSTTWSLWQGLAENVRRYRNSPVMGKGVADGFKPIVLSEGKRVAFPRPTKKVKEPRVRKDLVRRTGGPEAAQA
ncbi:unnamed protein product [Prorocentrum cordatum]|uniref:Uncharacterized protein n=1 Tax=Prorocentrum cordatum TaxID=2364126 RepID=A0ABN9SIF2_9DINO|nr:unnamed protein product [Polarella glacialis]CAK0833071.1 unnamed protein product [Polarella glacialis]